MTANLIVGLDIGTTKTCAVIGELSGDPAEALHARALKIRGVGQARTSGVRGDTVTSLDAATEAIKQAVREAELMAGATVDRVFAGIAGEHIQARSSMGVVAVTGDEITPSDMDRVHEVARAIPLGQDRELLHVIPTDYCVDYQAGIKRALGLTATRLETEVFVITTAASAAANIRKAVSKAGYGVQLVLEPLAAARAVLTEDEKEVGVAMIEIGGGTTDLAVFQDGRLRHVQVIPIGGDAVTGDLVKVLGVPWTEAQKLKEQHGHAIASQIDGGEAVEVQGPTPGTVPRLVSRELVARIAEQRMEETLLMVKDELVQQDLLWRLGAGIVLTGGGAALPGMIDLAQRVFPMPVRLGVPGEGLTGLAQSVGRPRFATAVGLALHGAERFGETGQGATTLTSGVMSKMGAWLKEFF